ncbi:MAG: hypothetical protein Q4D80_05595, partial [Pseudomonadota bacterium]|nr:hypothetical protein [Pseudomonadota bacterium]
IASDNGSDETCEGYNISESTRNSKQYSSGCYSCSACTNKAGKKMYKCEAVSNATWDNSHGVCCTNGETYDVAERKCCPSSGCVHDDCPEPKIWSPSLQSCECPSNRDENDAGECCNVGEHADGSICCPTNKHNQNGTCVCDDGYIPDGTGCKLPNCGGYDVTDTSKYDTNCYTCEACADDGKKFKCTQKLKDGYKLDGGKCVKKQSCSDYGLVSETSCDKSKNTFTASRTDDFGEKCGTCVKKKSCADYSLISESSCDTSKNTFTASRTDDFGEKCGTCIKKKTEDCSKYLVQPWVVNGPSNFSKCQELGYAAPCGDHATCGGVEYIECKKDCSSSGGSTDDGNTCTAGSYTASVTCSLSYSTDQCCTAFGCSSSKGCGTGYYKCEFNIPSCAFSHVAIHATDATGQDKVIVQQGAGKTTRTLNNYQIPGPYTPCEFYSSGSSSEGKVAGYAVSGKSYTWRCEYTKRIR